MATNSFPPAMFSVDFLKEALLEYLTIMVIAMMIMMMMVMVMTMVMMMMIMFSVD